jgi:hypothetical protein
MVKNLYFLLAEVFRAGLNASLAATLKGRALRGNGSVAHQSSIRSNSSNRSKRFERLEQLERFEPDSPEAHPSSDPVSCFSPVMNR